MAKVPTSSDRNRAAYKRAWEKSGSGRASRALGGNKVKTPKGVAPAERARSASDRGKGATQDRYAKDAPKVSFGNTGYKEDFDV